jgi:hypothetical protein
MCVCVCVRAFCHIGFETAYRIRMNAVLAGRHHSIAITEWRARKKEKTGATLATRIFLKCCKITDIGRVGTFVQLVSL